MAVKHWMRNAMGDYTFGYWEFDREYLGSSISVRPVADIQSAKCLADQMAQRGKEYFMPHLQNRDGGPFTGRFELPTTHILSISGQKKDGQLGAFMVLTLGFLHGLRFTVEGEGHLLRTPWKENSLVSFCLSHSEVIPCLEKALETWYRLGNPERTLLFAAIHWYLVGQSYPFQFERFNWQYSVLDSLAKLHKQKLVEKYKGGGKTIKFENIPHRCRPILLSSIFGLIVPEILNDFSELIELRNNLVHEARWLEKPLGYTSGQDGHEMIMALTHFNSQVILGALGIDCTFRREQSYGSFQVIPLGLLE